MKMKAYAKVGLGLAVMLCFCAPARAQSVEFSQMSFYFDDSTNNFEYTDWGTVDFSYTGSSSIMYFNLWVTCTIPPCESWQDWQVQNVPIQSVEGSGIPDTIRYYFDLQGLGENDQIVGSFSFTEDVQPSTPSGVPYDLIIGLDTVEMNAGLYSETTPSFMPDSLAAPGPKVGGAVADATKHVNEGFPNQDCGKNECVPAAVSNSLRFLNTKHGLGLTENQMKISTLATQAATGWDAGGCPVETWFTTKDRYMTNNNYGVTTRKETDLSKLIAEIDDNQDIELVETWVKDGKTYGHCVSVVGIKLLASGKYSLTIVDDSIQGPDGNGGLSKRNYIIDPGTRVIDDNGIASKFEYAVVECPIPEGIPTVSEWGLIVMTLIGLTAGTVALGRRRRRAVA